MRPRPQKHSDVQFGPPAKHSRGARNSESDELVDTSANPVEQSAEPHVWIVRAERKPIELSEEQGPPWRRAHSQAEILAGLAFLLLMIFGFAYLAYEGGKFMWGDFTTGIAETERRMDRN